MVEVKVIECCQNGNKFYMSVMKASILRKICYVSRRDEDKEEGYQRNLVFSRAQDIAKYMSQEDTCIPSVIILSANSLAEFNYNNDTSIVSFSDTQKSFMVLDGQHRLYGYFIAFDNSGKDFDIPVVMFNNLSIRQEVNLFIDINTNQKGVPSALLIDIKRLTGRETDLETLQRYLFDELDKNSIMAGKFSPVSPKKGYIARSVFNEATKNMLTVGYFSDQDNDIILKGIRNYLEAINKVFEDSKSENAKLTVANMFKAVFEIFNDVIDKSFKDYGDLKISSLINVLEPISSLQYDTYTGTNKATLSKIVLDMKSVLNGYSKKYQNIDSSTIF